MPFPEKWLRQSRRDTTGECETASHLETFQHLYPATEGQQKQVLQGSEQGGIWRVSYDGGVGFKNWGDQDDDYGKGDYWKEMGNLCEFKIVWLINNNASILSNLLKAVHTDVKS